jgi:hypothetical protein
MDSHPILKFIPSSLINPTSSTETNFLIMKQRFDCKSSNPEFKIPYYTAGSLSMTKDFFLYLLK